ncbi:acyl-CoA synthetase [Aquihabitans sp. G128]|uniref:acyl-CoA synthetase n=1 Tax=Aquihabitans sp. G128 TaxID=2849779 RepID=UPI001C21ADD2|nr:acyl-CoA synthetase [Aquihabitans sp. G128]QXC62092.1 acyl-CoA synthetase [Aquihabitans sp. G128]
MELNLAAIHEALATALADRPCLVWRDRTWTWAEVTDRTRRLASVLAAHGIGRNRDLADCEGWESPHDHVALYLHNSNAYLEAQLAASKAGAAAFNVNYRYVADELAYLFRDSGAAAIVYHGAFAATLADVLPRLDHQPLLVRVDDGSGDDLLPGAIDYEEAIAGAASTEPVAEWRPDDLYVLYTGGTTGNPKGVLWRQADFLVAALGVRRKDGTDFESLDELVGPALRRNLATLPAPPLMHGAAMWNALSTWISGGTIVIQDTVDRLDPADVLDTCERHGVTSLLIVGDAFARPLLDEQRRQPRDLSALRFLLTGGAILSPRLRAELLEVAPQLRIVDVLGSSETGRQAVANTRAGDDLGPTRFEPSATTAVLDATLSRRLAPDEADIGWLAQGGRIPRGYLGDEAKTRATFPEIAGERWAVAGDRAAWRADGSIELHGRESVTINTGGEKVFAEEVEQAIKHHPGVYDALVVGRPSERWGQEVVAVVAVRPGAEVDLEGLREVAAAHLARYKLPKDVVFRDRISRSPSGKPDYAWARDQLG